MKNSDTIAAIATPLGSGGIGIIRMSGGKAKDIAREIFSPNEPLVHRKMVLGELAAQGFCDHCLAVYFQAPHSYTGEDVVEFHCHGGRALVAGVLGAVLAKGARLAENGEFTKRAFLNGKINLSESEAVIDMINAQSTAELNAQYSQMLGTLSREIGRLQRLLTDCIGRLEVVLDYPEEEADEAEISSPVRVVLESLEKLLESYAVGGLLKSGVKVALVGKPNVGKSSLLNSLLGYNRAIISSTAGTTRDVIGEFLEIEGMRFQILDTAGIRDSENEIEGMGVQRSLESIKESDLVLFVIDGSEEQDCRDERVVPLLAGKKVLLICNKKDVKNFRKKTLNGVAPLAILPVSAKSGEGVAELKKAMYSAFCTDNLTERACLLTNERHFDCVRRAAGVCRELLQNAHKLSPDMVAMELKSVWDVLGEITGTTATDEIVNNIFSKFCLGK